MKALFLDIDGVLQPHGQQDRFRHLEEIPALCTRLNHELQNGFDYEAYIANSYSHLCDIGAVYYDWNPGAVERLHRILDTTGARIVLSTDWREEGLERMRGLLAIHHLDGYLEDSTFYVPNPTPTIDWEEREKILKAWKPIGDSLLEGLRKLYPKTSDDWFAPFVDWRTMEIREYLDRHPEITAYVAVDDRNLELGLDGHFVQTSNYLTEEHVQQCLEILDRNDGPYPLPQELKTPELEEWRKTI